MLIVANVMACVMFVFLLLPSMEGRRTSQDLVPFAVAMRELPCEFEGRYLSPPFSLTIFLSCTPPSMEGLMIPQTKWNWGRG